MSQILNPGGAALDLSSIYTPVQDSMTLVEEILQQELKNDSPFVDELLQYGCLLGGKRLRPALLLLAAKAVGEIRPEHIQLAAVVEMIHTATLIHDDILDEADKRRHLETVNARWNNETSVLLGDYLFTHAFYLASTTGSADACRVIGQATNTVCEGELRQVGSREHYDLGEAEYIEIIESKTAALCACSCQLGAMFAGGSDEIVQQLYQYGMRLGTAFQIADDLLDVEGEEATTGKSLGTDLEKQKPTLPLIRSLQVATPEQRKDLIQLLGRDPKPSATELRPWFEMADALTYSRQRAIEFTHQAIEQLQDLPDSDAADVLKSIPHFVVARDH